VFVTHDFPKAVRCPRRHAFSTVVRGGLSSQVYSRHRWSCDARLRRSTRRSPESFSSSSRESLAVTGVATVFDGAAGGTKAKLNLRLPDLTTMVPPSAGGVLSAHADTFVERSTSRGLVVFEHPPARTFSGGVLEHHQPGLVAVQRFFWRAPQRPRQRSAGTSRQLGHPRQPSLGPPRRSVEAVATPCGTRTCSLLELERLRRPALRRLTVCLAIPVNEIDLARPPRHTCRCRMRRGPLHLSDVAVDNTSTTRTSASIDASEHLAAFPPRRSSRRADRVFSTLRLSHLGRSALVDDVCSPVVESWLSRSPSSPSPLPFSISIPSLRLSSAGRFSRALSWFLLPLLYPGVWPPRLWLVGFQYRLGTTRRHALPPIRFLPPIPTPTTLPRARASALRFMWTTRRCTRSAPSWLAALPGICERGQRHLRMPYRDRRDVIRCTLAATPSGDTCAPDVLRWAAIVTFALDCSPMVPLVAVVSLYSPCRRLALCGSLARAPGAISKSSHRRRGSGWSSGTPPRSRSALDLGAIDAALARESYVATGHRALRVRRVRRDHVSDFGQSVRADLEDRAWLFGVSVEFCAVCPSRTATSGARSTLCCCSASALIGRGPPAPDRQDADAVHHA